MAVRLSYATFIWSCFIVWSILQSTNRSLKCWTNFSVTNSKYSISTISMTLYNASITSIDWGKFITSNWKIKEDWLSMINSTKLWRISILLNISSISSRLSANKLKKQQRIFWILKNTVIFCCMVKTKQPSVMSLFGQLSYPKRIKFNPRFDCMNSEN